jgi:hypothetical protein
MVVPPKKSLPGVVSQAVQALQVAARPSVAGSLERLRSHAAHAAQAPTPPQLHALVSALTLGQDLPTVAAAAGLPPDRVVEAVSELGAWLSHNHGAAAFRLVPPGTLAQPPLFVLPTSATPADAQADDVEIPDGFTPRALGRDVRAALAAVIAHQPSTTELQRFVERTRRSGEVVVSYEAVATVSFFARLGRLDDLGEVSPRSAAFSSLVVKSYDLLEVARSDALTALSSVIAAEASVGSAELLTEALTVAGQLAGGRLRRAEGLVGRLGTGDGVADLFEREQSALAQRVLAATRTWAPATPAELDDAQVRRIAAAAGLEVDRDRSVERDIRQRLADLGRAADADVLIPACLDAIANGCEEEFWERLHAASA